MNPEQRQAYITKFLAMGISKLPASAMQRTFNINPVMERGQRATPENSLKYLYRLMWVDPDLRQRILDIRRMDAEDGRVKKLHNRMASSMIKGGLRLKSKTTNKRLARLWMDYERRLHLNRHEKLQSDARGLIMEGNLPMQWVLGMDQAQVVAGIRMPSETIMPVVDMSGRIKDVSKAYVQLDVATGAELASFALWQLTLARLTPDNYDDQGCLGRPYMDASRGIWKKLVMTDEDLVIRRHTRAAQKLSHVLEGATEPELQAYEQKVMEDRDDVNTDYFSNKKGSVSVVQGDANLDQIADVAYLLDSFYAGAPAPKGLFGYVGDLSRDILEDLKRDYYEEIDALQDTLSQVYEVGFRFDLLLKGINPDDHEFNIQFAERRTETANQAADRALKLQSLGASRQTVWETANLDPETELNRRDNEAKSNDPYPDPANIGNSNVSITPGNRRKGESATDVSNP